MENPNNNSYRSILKATGVFGMMQGFKIAISIISSKFIALYLGPLGIGIVSLLNNAVNIILAITNFEFLKTATREIALNNDSSDKNKLTETIATLQKMAIFIGLLGAVISLLFSKTISYLTFGSYDKQHWFVVLSLYFLITSFSNARLSILQGVNNIKTLAWSNIVIAFFTAIGSIIIYYFLRIEGILWVMVYSSFVFLLFTVYFTRHFPFSIRPFDFNVFYSTSLPIFKLGFFMSLNLIFGQIANFIIKLYINDNGNSGHVIGFYEVSTVVLINYLGLIFNAMSFDFYPKLTAISNDNNKVKQLVNSQIEIAIILVTPAIVFLYFFAPYLIQILYSKAFLNSFIILKMALFSVILKAVIFPLGYIVLVKGDRKLFFKQALLSDFLNLFFSIILYHYCNLIGLGIAYILNYVVYGMYIYYVIHKEYRFHFDYQCKKLIAINSSIGVLAIVIIYGFDGLYFHVLISILFLISLAYSLIEMNKRINVKQFIQSKINKRNQQN